MVFEKSLTAMVKGIRAHRGKENEYINTCIQEIRKEVNSKNLATKSMAVLKLAYLNMMGYDMSWSTFAVVEVMSHNRFAIKRPGYLAASICFNDTTDVGLLTINLFKKDFGSKSQYECGMALTCLSSICTPEISRDIITDLLAMLSSSRAYLRKKTVLSLYRIFVKDPPALRQAFPKLKDRLGDEDQGVLTATVNTFLELARANARNYLSLVPQLYHILNNTTNNWLSIKLLKLFQLLCPLEPRLPPKMVEPLTNFLNTTKAQSVEFEAIRCTVKTMPEGTALMALAIEKLQNFLNSSDRNLRFLALELFREVIEKPQIKDKVPIPDLHAKVLLCIEESDVTARKIALQLLDRIVSPSSFVDTVKKLMEFSKNAASADEFVGTILRMGARDRYALVEDFPWYLLVLAEIARNKDSSHAAHVAEQFLDITVRVSQVRPYTVALALSMLDGSLAVSATESDDNPSANASGNVQEGSLAMAAPMVGACAWLIGEYNGDFEKPSEQTVVKAVKAILVPKNIQSLEPAIQSQCVWAATKLYLGAATHAPGALAELHSLMEAKLPGFIQSTHVDVSERAALSLHLCKILKADASSVAVAAPLFADQLLPVHPEAQLKVPIPDGLNLDEPFFKQEEVPREVYAPVRSDPQDPFAIAANYKDDLGFLAAQDRANQAPGPSTKGVQQSSMFYLQAKDKGASASGEKAEDGSAEQPAAQSPAAPVDPLERMRAQLMAKGNGPMKFEVMRDDVVLPGQSASDNSTSVSQGGAAATSAAVLAAAAAAGSAELPRPADKELTDLQGRLWSMCFRDDNVGIYACVRSKNVKKQQLRIELRCERVVQDSTVSVTNITLSLPDGVTAQEADGSGTLSLVPGELQERSAKVKANLSLTPFTTPVGCTLVCQLGYVLARKGDDATPTSSQVSVALELRLPATTFLTPLASPVDEVQEYIQTNASKLSKGDQALSLAMPNKDAKAVADELPALVGRCAGLCYFYGVQQSGAEQGKAMKFLLVAQPPSPSGRPSTLPGQEQPLPPGAQVLCLCAAKPQDQQLEVKLTVKCVRKDVCEDVCAQLGSIFRELVEGRLRTE